MSLVAKVVRKFKSAVHDARHGGYTGGIHPTRYGHRGATHTVSTKHALIPFLLDPVLRAGDVFVDVGCGRGRMINWVCDDGRATRIFGLEIEKKFAAEVALRHRHHETVTIVAGDALTALPDSATLFYLWNPFDGSVMERFKEALIAKYALLGTLQSVRLVYHHCLFADVWRTDPRCRVEPIALPDDEENEAILVTFGPSQQAAATLSAA